MSAPVFATKWQFIYAWVLIGVNRTSGQFFGSQTRAGDSVVCVWTTDEGATAAVPGDIFDIQQIKVRDLLAMLPAGVGVVIDPGSDSGLTIEPDYVVDLKRFVHPFPGGARLEFKVWLDLPDAVRDAIVREVAARPFIEEVRAFLYTVDDGPYLGCIAYRTQGGHESQDSAIGAINRALPGDLAELDVASVSIVGLVDVPDNVRRDLPPETLIFSAR
jgi:hypothetical protein